MNPIRTTLATIAACGLLFTAGSALAQVKDYQYTGVISAMDDNSFTVTKGKEKSQFAKDAETKLPEGAKVGDKVTVHYMMHATTVDASGAAAKEKAPAAKGKKAAKMDKAEAATEEKPNTTGAPKPVTTDSATATAPSPAP